MGEPAVTIELTDEWRAELESLTTIFKTRRSSRGLAKTPARLASGVVALPSMALMASMVRDIVGPYLDPPERALALCVDEKSQVLPVCGSAAPKIRHGGEVIGRWFKQHRAKEFLTSLREIDANVPEDLDVHLAKRSHWHAHFTPTGASGLNQVDRLFTLLTERQLRRGVHRSKQEPEQAIKDYIDDTLNDDPKPFQWTKSADQILASIKRFCIRTIQAAERQKEIERHSEAGL